MARIKVSLDSNAYIANHQAAFDYFEKLMETDPRGPAESMLLLAATENLRVVRQSCPDELLSVLGLYRDREGGVAPKAETEG